MDFIEAVESGRPFKRPNQTMWHRYYETIPQVDETILVNEETWMKNYPIIGFDEKMNQYPCTFQPCDILADDWMVKV